MEVNKNINKGFVSLDRVADYIPVVSTISNLTDLFIKTVILPHIKQEKIEKNHYFVHLQEKDLTRSLKLLVPVIGNLIVALKEISKKLYIRKNYSLHEHQLGIMGDALRITPHHVKDSAKLVRVAVNSDGLALKYASKRIQNKKSVVLKAVENNGRALEFASDRLKKDKDIALRALKQTEDAYQYIDDELKKDTDIKKYQPSK
ncbi:MAG: DUF4116 domain-containing protein [Parachlamydiaceae bacterium]